MLEDLSSIVPSPSYRLFPDRTYKVVLRRRRRLLCFVGGWAYIDVFRPHSPLEIIIAVCLLCFCVSISFRSCSGTVLDFSVNGMDDDVEECIACRPVSLPLRRWLSRYTYKMLLEEDRSVVERYVSVFDDVAGTGKG